MSGAMDEGVRPKDRQETVTPPPSAAQRHDPHPDQAATDQFKDTSQLSVFRDVNAPQQSTAAGTTLEQGVATEPNPYQSPSEISEPKKTTFVEFRDKILAGSAVVGTVSLAATISLGHKLFQAMNTAEGMPWGWTAATIATGTLTLVAGRIVAECFLDKAIDPEGKGTI
jgi:hypothetical protein